MIFRSLDVNHDWTFGKGRNNFARDVKAIKLNVKTRILSWLGDCFFAQTEGIDWVNRLGSKNQKDLLDADLRTIILQSEGVLGITAFESDVDSGRNYRASFSIDTIFGVNFTETINLGE